MACCLWYVSQQWCTHVHLCVVITWRRLIIITVSQKSQTSQILVLLDVEKARATIHFATLSSMATVNIKTVTNQTPALPWRKLSTSTGSHHSPHCQHSCRGQQFIDLLAAAASFLKTTPAIISSTFPTHRPALHVQGPFNSRFLEEARKLFAYQATTVRAEHNYDTCPMTRFGNQISDWPTPVQ